jgi:benzoyl-CoA-dihydrodiol lyase
MGSTTQKPPVQVDFERHPATYKHITLKVEGAVAKILLNIPEDGGFEPGYLLKLNSYDLGVDLELADAVNRIRFEHPEVSCVLISSLLEGCFSSGANIFMLGSSTHAFKVNFCKYTNETRLSIEDATQYSGQTYIAAVNGVCSGGGYELALACDQIFLVDDRRSAVSLPEVPYLGVLPGTGGLTRVVDKRKIPRDRADVFCTLAEGLKAKKAKAWGFVDDIFPASRFAAEIENKAAQIAGSGYQDRQGITLDPLKPTIDDETIVYRHLRVDFAHADRVATLSIEGPKDIIDIRQAETLSADWYPLRLFRELDDALCRLRFNYPKVGLVLVKSQGSIGQVLAMDEILAAGSKDGHWFIRETLLFMKRTLKRMDVTAKSFFTLIEKDSCFAGSFLEFAFASDRIYMLDEQGVEIALSPLNHGRLPMGNALSRLATRFLGAPEKVTQLRTKDSLFDAQDAQAHGLVTLAYDELDWDDEIRLAIEERVSFSPDSLTGLEASLRFAGPETLETKIFGRLSAWQNWIFQRPNAVGERGALTLYGQPHSPQFDWNRT